MVFWVKASMVKEQDMMVKLELFTQIFHRPCV